MYHYNQSQCSKGMNGESIGAEQGFDDRGAGGCEPHPRLSPPILRLAWMAVRSPAAGAGAGACERFFFCRSARTASGSAGAVNTPSPGAASGAAMTCQQGAAQCSKSRRGRDTQRVPRI